MRLAWFSPVPPVRTGIAGRSAELVAALGRRGHEIDIYVDAVRPLSAGSTAVRSAHDFPWRHLQHAYDLTVYQFGNSSHHDYSWPYAYRYPGLLVLHDVRLHHARAALLLREKRTADYRSELAWNEPSVNPDLAELAIAGYDSALYYTWPMVRSLVQASRLVAVHGTGAAAELRSLIPDLADRIFPIRLGEGETLSPEREADARRAVRARYAIPDEAILFGTFGGLTPDKRIPQILDAIREVSRGVPSIRLMLAGAAAAHLDVDAEIAARDLRDRVIVTGYIETEDALTEHIAACDVSLNLRWPTARETSGPWLRALAAGRPTIITDLTHLGDVPALDARTWRINFVEDRGPRVEDRGPGTEDRAEPRLSTLEPRPSILDPRSSAVCVSIDILDEAHSLRLAMRRLATDPELRGRLGRAAREWWHREHALECMIDDYERVMADAASRQAPVVDLPSHLRDNASGRLRSLAAPFGVAAALLRDGLLE